MNDTHYDIAIIGGGPVGAALALALRGSNLKVCVLESRAENTASQDARALALSYGSRLLLDRLGVWNSLNDVSPIRTIHISQQKSFGRAVLRAAELNVPELGYVLPYPALQAALDKALQHATSHVLYGSQVTALQGEIDYATISYQQGGEEKSLQTRLAVVADGGKLLAQQHPPEVRDYGQSALITHITCSAPQLHKAFERFTPHGPIALLPFKDGYELVWTASHQAAQAMLNWDDATFLRELQQQFGDRVGDFLTVSKRACFPLGLRRAPQQTPQPHVVLLGNAAQTLHPVAGQGFNLGLRDAWELAQEILNVAPDALGTEAMLNDYRKQRRTDREAGIRFTDGLVRLFSNDLPLISAGRAAALTALDCLPFAKKFVAKRMMFGANG
jgi:2-octaprenyl-6-methoxyphenol hydroxylase